MKRYIIYIFSGLLSAMVINSCKDEPFNIEFENQNDTTIFNYLEQHNDNYSDFIDILKVGGIYKTLGAYNPFGNNYTLFLPTNDAIDKFIDNNGVYSSLADILGDVEFCRSFSRFHILNMSIPTNDFPFGKFAQKTLSGDELIAKFTNSSYVINNQSVIIESNIELSNGYIHVIELALTPNAYTTFNILSNNAEYSIFVDALRLTGLDSLINVSLKENLNASATTVFAEPDSIYHSMNILSVEDLIEWLGVVGDNYKHTDNRLYRFIGYHILKGSFSISEFEDESTLFSTFADIPVNIDGTTGVDVAINLGKQNFDTIIESTDTTIINYITFAYDESNIITLSGVLHFIDQIMTIQEADSDDQTYQFNEDGSLAEYKDLGGKYLLDDPDAFTYLDWIGADLYYYKSLDDTEYNAGGEDFIYLDGDFTISFTTPEVVSGDYTLILRVGAYDNENAVIDVYLDGVKLGGAISLTEIAPDEARAFQNIEIATVSFSSFKRHVVEVKSLIPGMFRWDFVRFEMIKSK